MKRNIWIAAVSLCLLVAASRGALAQENWVPEPGIWTVSKEWSITFFGGSFIVSTRATNGRKLTILASFDATLDDYTRVDAYTRVDDLRRCVRITTKTIELSHTDGLLLDAWVWRDEEDGVWLTDEDDEEIRLMRTNSPHEERDDFFFAESPESWLFVYRLIPTDASCIDR